MLDSVSFLSRLLSLDRPERWDTNPGCCRPKGRAFQPLFGFSSTSQTVELKHEGMKKIQERWTNPMRAQKCLYLRKLRALPSPTGAQPHVVSQDRWSAGLEDTLRQSGQPGALAWGVQWMGLFSFHMNESSAVQWGTVLLKKLFFGWDITLIKLSGGPDHFVGIKDPMTSSNDFGVLATLQLGMLCLIGLPIQLLFRNVVFTKSTFRWAHVKLPFQSWCQNGKRIVKTISDDYW